MRGPPNNTLYHRCLVWGVQPCFQWLLSWLLHGWTHHMVIPVFRGCMWLGIGCNMSSLKCIQVWSGTWIQGWNVCYTVVTSTHALWQRDVHRVDWLLKYHRGTFLCSTLRNCWHIVIFVDTLVIFVATSLFLLTQCYFCWHIVIFVDTLLFLL